MGEFIDVIIPLESIQEGGVFDLREDLLAWLDHHGVVRNSWTYQLGGERGIAVRFEFRDARLATLFKLTWGGR